MSARKVAPIVLSFVFYATAWLWAASTSVATSGGATYHNTVLGVELTIPNGLDVVEDQYLMATGYGISLVESTGSTHGELVLRVSWLYNEAVDVSEAIANQRSNYPILDLTAVPVEIGGISGEMIQQLPGRTGSTIIYVVANSRLYEIIYGGEHLDRRAITLLTMLRFISPTRDLEALGLPYVRDETQYPSIPPQERFLAEVEATTDEVESQLPAPSFAISPAGCANWPTNLFLQTPITDAANGTGWSQAGPSYYNHGLHRRCNDSLKLNDYFAMDYPLRSGDGVYAPFPGKVIWAGWAGGGWAGLGRIVIVEQWVGSAKYWSMSAHLNSINVAVGANVTSSTIIGYAGGSGYNSNTYWLPHLHQAIYLHANLNAQYGGIYGGQSVQPLNIHFFRGNGGQYPSYSNGQAVSY